MMQSSGSDPVLLLLVPRIAENAEVGLMLGRRAVGIRTYRAGIVQYLWVQLT